MANRKVLPSKKRKPTSYSIPVRVLEDFKELCLAKNLNASQVVEDLIVKFIKEND